jgi:hypothetical protein
MLERRSVRRAGLLGRILDLTLGVISLGFAPLARVVQTQNFDGDTDSPPSMFHFDGTSTVATPTSPGSRASTPATTSVSSDTIRDFCSSLRPERIDPSTKAALASGSSSAGLSWKKACTKEDGAPVTSQWIRTISLAIRARCSSVLRPSLRAHR